MMIKSNYITRCILSLTLGVFFGLPSAVFATEQCSTPDRSFKEFLHRFEENVEFQRNRILLPFVFRSGEYMDMSVELWGIEKIKNLDYPLILSQQGRKNESVTESILLSTKIYVEVSHDGPPESDVYRVLYKFRSIDGCWFLIEAHDRSE